jgi:hypothetical protein
MGSAMTYLWAIAVMNEEFSMMNLDAKQFHIHNSAFRMTVDHERD